MTDADRLEMLERLAKLNGSLTRLGPGPLVTDDEAAAMSDDVLAEVVRGTEIQVGHVTTQLAGLT